MNNYDTAYELARQMRESEIYKSYCAAKERAFEKELNRDLYKQYIVIARGDPGGTVCQPEHSGRRADSVQPAHGRFGAQCGSGSVYDGRAQDQPDDERYLQDYSRKLWIWISAF